MANKNNRNYMLDKSICSFIIKAQMCSDAGKGIYEDYKYPTWRKTASEWGYNKKLYFIELACKKICQLKGKSGFHYYVEPANDNRWPRSPIIYFNFKLNGQRRQVSFHCPDVLWHNNRGVFYNYAIEHLYDSEELHDKHATRWDRNRGGSRDACWDLGYYLRKEVKM